MQVLLVHPSWTGAGFPEEQCACRPVCNNYTSMFHIAVCLVTKKTVATLDLKHLGMTAGKPLCSMRCCCMLHAQLHTGNPPSKR